MAHEVYWMKKDKLLYANYVGHQTVETITACLDDMVAEFDAVQSPVFVLINWTEVTSMEPKALLEVTGHRAYSHPMAARGVLVGFDPVAGFQNQVSSTQTRGTANTIYFKTMDEALVYLENFLDDEDEADEASSS